MYTVILLLIATLPSFFLLLYYYKQDKAKPEPIGLIVKVFIWGCLSVIVAIILEMIVDAATSPFIGRLRFISIAFKSFVIAGLIEESLKMLVVRRSIFRNPYFDEVMDGIIYTIVASLGFATVENIFFVLQGGLSIGLIRAFTALPLHAIAGGLMGYYIGKARFAGTREEQAGLFGRGLTLAIMVHGFYDLIVFSGAEFDLLIFIVLPFLLTFGFIILSKFIKNALEEDKRLGRQTTNHSDFTNEIKLNDIYNEKNKYNK